MQVVVTARQMELTTALKDYVHNKVSKAEKYIHREYGVHVILEAHKLHHTAEIVVNVKGQQITAKGEGEDMYACIDKAMDKIEQQLRRYKEKLSHHKGSTSVGQEALVVEEALATES